MARKHRASGVWSSSKGSFKVQGLSELVKTLTDMPDAIRDKAVGKGTKEGAKVIQEAAIKHAPQDSGRLKENIVVRQNKDTKFDSEHSVVVRKIGKADNPKNSYYAYFLEHGTSKMTAKPFMRPAFEQNKESAVAVLAGYIREAVAAYRIKMRGGR